ncbi:MAG: hypothetical protein MJ016_05365 [Victivallaceae bacterium]|nr:hypothetical protein [Victivallaceae bacterium]
MSFSGAAYLERLGMFSVRLGLGNTFELMKRAGDPQKKLRFVHIAGTNGKGSTGAMLEAAFRGAGFRTGFYTSPHLIDVRERFRVGGKMIDEETFDRAAETLAGAAKDLDFTYFEFATVLAAKIFAEKSCDIVIWETGMGGRLDATNVVTPLACVITGVALDHQSVLGATLGEIAAEKAGIIKERVPVFVGKLPPDARRVVAARAAELDAPLFSPSVRLPEKVVFDPETRCQKFFCDDVEVALSLPGAMQRDNCRLAVAVLRHFAAGNVLDLERALGALSTVKWPGRMQSIGGVIVDGGHNPDGVGALTSSLAERYPGEKFVVVYGGFRDKAVVECLKIWAPLAEKMIFTALAPEKRASFSGGELAGLWRKIAPGIPCEAAENAADALERARYGSGGKIVVSGSLFLAGEVLSRLGGRAAAGDLV